MSAIHACVLAAGKGTRMGGSRPKVLFEAAGKPLIEWVLGALSEAGVNDIVVVVGFGKDDVIAKLPTGVRWAEQLPQLGTGHAVRCARAAFNDVVGDIIVTCGDMPLVTSATFRALFELRRRENADAALVSVPVEPSSSYGRIIRDVDGSVRSIIEYKDASEEQRKITEGNSGVYCFRSEALWPALEKLQNNNAQSELYLTDVIGILVQEGSRVSCMRLEAGSGDEGLGVNTPADLEKCTAALLAREKYKTDKDLQ